MQMDLKNLEQRFQEQLSREILISQRLRVVLTATLISVLILLLVSDFIYTEFYMGKRFPPVVVLPIAVGMTLFQFLMWRFISYKLQQDASVAHWVWYVQAGIEISGVTLALVALANTFQNPMSVLMSPVALAYALLIGVYTLHLNFKMSIFIGGLSAVEFLAWTAYLFWTSDTMHNIDPVFRIPMVYVTKATLLFLCGVGSAFVARELRRRVLDSYLAIEARDQEEAANEAKSAFLANMSHEIRTPLNAILGYAQLMDADTQLSSQQRQAVQIIGSSGNHLLNLINDVLDLSKIEAGHEVLQNADFDLSDMVRSVGAMFQLRCAQQGLSWSVAVSSDPVWVKGDEGKLRQVLVNLLGNAVKFTDTGEVALTVTQEMAASLGSGMVGVRFEVRDTGPGIPPERQAIIFDPFQQEDSGHRKGGTGLGLAIANRYVQLMGSMLEIDSTVGEGTRFSFVLTLPYAQTQEAQKTPDLPQVLHLADGDQVTALVVDDVDENRAIMKQILERVGVQVRLAENGAKALEKVAQAMPDIVFTDIHMPDMTGDVLMTSLFDTYGQDTLKVVAVSASVLSHQKEGYLDAGFDDFIDKPVQLARVYSCLENVLGVSFVTEEKATESTDLSVDVHDVVIDEAVWQNLMQAAHDHSITDLRKQLDVLEQSGEAERQMAEQLRVLAQNFDMAGVMKVLETIRHDA